MKRRSHRKSPIAFSPFKIYGELLQLSLQTSEMLVSSGEVITLRSKIIDKALAGKLSWSDPEFMRMWEEKVSATMEASRYLYSYMDYGRHGSLKPLINQPAEIIRIITKSSRPFHKKVRANAKRLKNKDGHKAHRFK